ncbi:NAD(P)H-binding protein [Streptomyces beijiangensis]|uniref:NAD(P)H-binding protein n=2 Tax=Streptomyces beijiangensis TaxID=163361 RepID=A0A939F498_9ACTN|nr:NAD(P)H-binding protein [Streptomyces beijiangensis]MBO0511418.1 NAD(P)H-binding protein [Streptomyces beijiangensis]
MILITGATGLVGSPLVDILHTEGADVRAVSRDPSAARMPVGVEVVEGDPSRPGTLAAAMDGVTSLFLHPRAAGERAAELVALARERGVRRVVAMAALNIDEPLADQPSRYRGDRNKEAETAAVESGLEWVSLRPGTFSVSSLHAWGGQIQGGDVVRGPYAQFAESPVHEQDLAAVAARALLGDDLVGRRLELTGPQSLTQEEMVAVIGDVIGRPLRYEEVPPEIAAKGMVQHGVPEPFVTALMDRYARDLGHPAPLTGEVGTILGRQALTYRQWVSEHAAAFRRASN